MVSPTRRVIQHGIAALQFKADKSSLASFHSTKKKLVFAESIQYDACLGYQDPNAEKSSRVILPVNIAVDSPPSIPFGSAMPDQSDQHATRVQNGDSNQGASSRLVDSADGGPGVTDKEAHDEFEKMIDDMDFKVWACGKCLSMGHLMKNCTNEVRCRSCFSYGHIKRNCLIRFSA
jgi:hypothetical protein